MDANDVVLLAMAPGEGRAALQKELESAGFNLLFPQSGREALFRLREGRAIFLGCDERLPDMDAFELCRLIRSQTEYAALPVGVFASSAFFSSPSMLQQGLECGLDAVFNLSKKGALRLASGRIAYLSRRRPIKADTLEPKSENEYFYGGQLRRCPAGARRSSDFLLSVLEACGVASSPLPYGVGEQRALELIDLRSNEQFLANLGHDIRDKAHSLVALADFVLEGETTERQRGMAQSMRPAVEALLSPLNEILTLYRGAAARALGASPKSEELAQSGRRILLVEDNPVNKTFVARLLERAGHFPTAVENGREAIEALKIQDFEAVLMDIQMPVMDGLEATAAIRKGEADRPGRSNRDIPIIALTAYAMDGDRERFLAAGLNEYVPKPLDIDALHSALRRALAVEPDEPSPEAAILVLDYEKTLHRLKGDKKFLRLLYATFNNDSDARMERFKTAVQAQDYGQILRQAHSLKGVAATIDAGRLREAAFSLELAARSQDPASVDAAFARLTARLEELQAQLSLRLQ